MNSIRMKYAKHLLTKEWFPFIVTFFVVSTIVFVVYSNLINIYDTTTRFSILPLTIPMTMFAVSLPLFVFNYKFTLTSADMFYQLPFKEKELKNTRIITGLIALVAVMTIAFLVGFGLLCGRYYTAPRIQYSTYGGYSYVKILFNPGFALLSFFIALLTISVEYFISCYITSLTSKPVPAIIISYTIQFFLFLIIPTILMEVSHIAELVDFAQWRANNPGAEGYYFSQYEYYYKAIEYAFVYSPSFVGANSIPNLIANRHVLNDIGAIDTKDFTALSGTIFYGSFVLFFAVGGVAAFLSLYSKNPSGECCGTYGLNNPKFNFLVYIIAIPLLLALSSVDLGFASFIIIMDVMIVASFFFDNALFLGTFKMPRYNYIVLAALAVLIFIAYLL